MAQSKKHLCNRKGNDLASVTITITDADPNDQDSAATIDTSTDWKEGDPESPAVAMAVAFIQLIQSIKEESEGASAGGAD